MPNRKAPKSKILTTIKAIRKLIADKEDTAQVFKIITTWGEAAHQRSFKKFMRHENAQKILTAEKPLLHYLQDSAWLKSLPEDSLGRHYYEFTTRENINADGLNDAFIDGTQHDKTGVSSEQIIFTDRQLIAHDLWHVVTGYNRDSLGELSLLAFTYRQFGNIGFLLIMLAGWQHLAKQMPKVKIGHALREGLRLGKQADWLGGADWEFLLTQPLADVRRILGITPPKHYQNTFAYITRTYPELIGELY